MSTSTMPARKDSFFASDLEVNEIDVGKIKPISEAELKFGRIFTDHMISVDWNKENGWQKP